MLKMRDMGFGTGGEFETSCAASKIGESLGFFERYDASAYCLDAPDRMPTGVIRVCRATPKDTPFIYFTWNYRE